MGILKKKHSLEEMTVKKFCDELFRQRDEGKSDKEIAHWASPYVFFVLSHEKEIDAECQRMHKLRSETLPNVD